MRLGIFCGEKVRKSLWYKGDDEMKDRIALGRTGAKIAGVP